jgi:hypothetical protein
VLHQAAMQDVWAHVCIRRVLERLECLWAFKKLEHAAPLAKDTALVGALVGARANSGGGTQSFSFDKKGGL